MEFLTSWITNIIIFILLAVIVEMLLPQTSLQKYVKMVLGLLLIIIFLSPFFKLFSTDINNLLSTMSVSMNEQNISLENSIEKQKIEIQEGQHAYILEETAVQLKESTEKELMEEFDYAFQNIHLEVKEPLDTLDSIEQIVANLDSIQVSLVEAKEDSQIVDPVEEVNVSLSQPEETEIDFYSEPIIRFLSDKWGVDMEKIHLSIERGNEGVEQ